MKDDSRRWWLGCRGCESGGYGGGEVDSCDGGGWSRSDDGRGTEEVRGRRKERKKIPFNYTYGVCIVSQKLCLFIIVVFRSVMMMYCKRNM